MIDLVRAFSHLGHLITSDSDDGEDITNRKHSFIGQINNTLCFLVNYPLLLNIIYFIHIIQVILDVSYGRYQIVTLKNFVLLETRVESSVSDSRCSITTFVSMSYRLRQNRRSLNFVRSCIRHESAFVPVIALHGLHARSRSLFGRNMVYCAERFNCSVNDLIYGQEVVINLFNFLGTIKLISSISHRYSYSPHLVII